MGDKMDVDFTLWSETTGIELVPKTEKYLPAANLHINTQLSNQNFWFRTLKRRDLSGVLISTLQCTSYCALVQSLWTTNLVHSTKGCILAFHSDRAEPLLFLNKILKRLERCHVTHAGDLLAIHQSDSGFLSSKSNSAELICLIHWVHRHSRL